MARSTAPTLSGTASRRTGWWLGCVGRVRGGLSPSRSAVGTTSTPRRSPPSRTALWWFGPSQSMGTSSCSAARSLPRARSPSRTVSHAGPTATSTSRLRPTTPATSPSSGSHSAMATGTSMPGASAKVTGDPRCGCPPATPTIGNPPSPWTRRAGPGSVGTPTSTATMTCSCARWTARGSATSSPSPPRRRHSFIRALPSTPTTASGSPGTRVARTGARTSRARAPPTAAGVFTIRARSVFGYGRTDACSSPPRTFHKSSLAG